MVLVQKYMNRQLEMNRVQKETHTHSANGFRRKVSLQFKKGWLFL